MADQEDLRRKVRKFKLVFGAILLEALNRNLDSPWRVEKCFERKEDREKIHQILNLENGLYVTCSARLYEGIETNDLEKIVEGLKQFRNINKTLLVMIAARLQELAKEKDGELI